MLTSLATRVVPAIAVALASTSALAATDTFRCKNDLVNLGASKASVLQKCGEPVYRDSFCRPTQATPVTPGQPASTTVVNVNACQQVDDWTYNPGRGQFMTSLKFESGKLVGITYGDRVK